MKFILGKKLAMTQLWVDDQAISVTPVLVSPCIVSQVKTLKTDGYEALQIACGQRKVKNINKPQQGHFKLANINPMHVREFRLNPVPEVQIGQQISLDSFIANELVDVTGISKGRGFQGVVKRHHFAGGRKTHGNKDQLRMPGSIGAKGPARVFKGKKMGGRMGGDRVTVKNLNIVNIDLANNLLFIQGGVPGAINSLLMIKAPGELKFQTATQLIEKDITVEKAIKQEVVNDINQAVVTENQSSNIEDKQVSADNNSDNQEINIDKNNADLNSEKTTEKAGEQHSSEPEKVVNEIVNQTTEPATSPDQTTNPETTVIAKDSPMTDNNNDPKNSVA